MYQRATAVITTPDLSGIKQYTCISAYESKDQVSSDLDQAQMLWVGFTHVSPTQQTG